MPPENAIKLREMIFSLLKSNFELLKKQMPEHIANEIIDIQSQEAMSQVLIEYCNNMAPWKLTN